MMLHRHFEQEKSKNITTLADVTPDEEKYVSAVFPPEEQPVEAPKRRRRSAKTEE